WTTDLGLNANIDLCQEHAGSGGTLGFYVNLAWRTGDFVLVEDVSSGDEIGAAFFAPFSESRWMMFLSFRGVPIQRATSILPTIPDGGCGYYRWGTLWPGGFGGQTLNFVSVSGVPGVPGTIGVSNEVTIVSQPGPGCNWGIKDDGTFESGWVVSIPAGSSDYFSNWFNCGFTPPVTAVTDFKLAVFDFGTTRTAYPLSGVFIANATLDPSGWTPDLSMGWGVQPFTFPPGGGIFVTNDINPDIPYSTFGTDDVHGAIQFPPGDSGYLGVGGDTTPTPAIAWGSTWTLNGYQTPANRFDAIAGWGLRLGAR
ncbi:MAG: hypothetical protein AB1486_23000, partial [Planctomycetota bacterium]